MCHPAKPGRDPAGALYRAPSIDREPRRACVHQHVRAADGRLTVVGEHVMGAARPLTLVPGFFGARRAADTVTAALAAEENLKPQPEEECL